MILNFTIHDNNLFKEKTIFSFEASKSTAKDANTVEYNVAHLKKPIKLLKMAAILGSDEGGKEHFFKMILNMLDWENRYCFNELEEGTYMKINYLALVAETNLLHQHTIVVLKNYNNKSYIERYYKAKDRKKVVIEKHVINEDDSWNEVYDYCKRDNKKDLIANTLPKVEYANIVNEYNFLRLKYGLINPNHKKFMLEFISAILQENVVDMFKYDDGRNLIKYIDKNGIEQFINYEWYNYQIRFSIEFICSLFTKTNTLFLIDSLFNLIHPHIVRFLLNIMHSEEFYNNNQVIFTTHNAELINSDYMRADQIWFFEKNDNNNSILFSVQDFEGIKEDNPFHRWYLAGKFGALPKLFFSYNK